LVFTAQEFKCLSNAHDKHLNFVGLDFQKDIDLNILHLSNVKRYSIQKFYYNKIENFKD